MNYEIKSIYRNSDHDYNSNYRVFVKHHHSLPLATNHFTAIWMIDII